jgi:quinoprotein glucose dehydrogenase
MPAAAKDFESRERPAITPLKQRGIAKESNFSLARSGLAPSRFVNTLRPFMPFPTPLSSTVGALFLALAASAFSAEIEGGSGKVHKLKPEPRKPEPTPAAASDGPQQAQAKFKLLPGFSSALWAAEPMLGNPVAFCLDEKGRVFVAETYRYRTSALDIRHYMFMLEDDLASRTAEDRIAFTKKNFPTDWQQLEVQTEAVRFLEDRDGDGKADFSSVYADGMNTLLDGINSGVLAHEGQVWCSNMPNLWRFSGLTAEGKAEKRESLSFGYGVRFSFTGHDMHGLALGPDGRLYFSFGDRGAHVKTKEGKELAFPDEGAVFRCELDGSHMEVVYRGLRNPQELAFDDHGNLFTGDNDCDQGDQERWVYLVEGGDAGWRVGWQHPPLGKENNMWLTEKMWKPRSEDSPAYILAPILNIPDGPSGVVHYPGTGLPAEFKGAFFVCGFKGSSARSAISWWTVKEDGAGFAPGRQPAPFVDHAQATDVDFGPDSKIYFSEWGEGWEGTGRGRIFTVAHEESLKAQAPQVAEVQKLLGEGFKQRPSAELARLLGHADQRIRLRAQWALAARPDAAAQFLAVAKSGAGLARLHGLWGLGHVARLAGYRDAAAPAQVLAPLLALLGDKDPEVRAQAAKVLGDGKVSAAHGPLIKALKDENARVRFFAAMSLSKIGGQQIAGPIVELLRQNDDKDQYLRHAAIIALAASGNAQAIGAAAKDSSKAVRLAALLTLRRQGNPQIAYFLNDADPFLVKEAARAIVDGGIDRAMPEVAKLLAKPTRDANLTLRALNAAFRTGDAAALAKFAAEDSHSEKLRNEALHLLGTFARPFPRDRISGNFRPLPQRDAAPAIAALGGAMHALLKGKPAIATSAIAAAQSLGAKDSASLLIALVGKPEVDARVRAAALRAVASFHHPQLAEAIKAAIADKEASLRVEATALLGKLNPDDAARQLSTALKTAGVGEKKQIIRSLGELKGAAADKSIAALLDELKAGRIPPEAQLEVIEAAEKRDAADIKARLSAWQNSFPANDPLAKYSFALAGGDPLHGEKLFKEHAVAQCLRCHKVQGAGGDAGPDLTGIAAKKDRRYLLEGIVLPNAAIAEGFQSVMFTLKNGDIKAGIIKSETADTITVQMPVPGIPPETFRKADVKQRDNAPSGMPPGMGELLSKSDLRDILEYVATLK